MIKYLENKEEFETLISKKCLIDFYAEWCGPCKMLGAVLEEIESDINLPIIKINTDKFPDIAQRYGVMSIPTLILMENSQEISKHIGFMSNEEIKEFIK